MCCLVESCDVSLCSLVMFFSNSERMRPGRFNWRTNWRNAVKGRGYVMHFKCVHYANCDNYLDLLLRQNLLTLWFFNVSWALTYPRGFDFMMNWNFWLMIFCRVFSLNPNILRRNENASRNSCSFVDMQRYVNVDAYKPITWHCVNSRGYEYQSRHLKVWMRSY